MRKDASTASHHQVTVTSRRPVQPANRPLALGRPIEASVTAQSWEDEAALRRKSPLTSKVYHNTQLDFVGAAARKRFADAFLKSMHDSSV